MGGGGRDQQQEVGGREQTSEHFGTSSNHLQLLLSGWWKRVNNRTFWDQLQSSSTAFVTGQLNLLQQDLWEEARHHCRLCHWSLNVLNDAHTSSTRSLGGILSSLQSLSLVISTFFNKIFGRNFVIIAVFVSGQLNLLQQDLWEEFRHHCRLCQWSLNVLHDAQTSSTRSLGGISSSLLALSVVSQRSE